jgi:hypothetical protein
MTETKERPIIFDTADNSEATIQEIIAGLLQQRAAGRNTKTEQNSPPITPNPRVMGRGG